MGDPWKEAATAIPCQDPGNQETCVQVQRTVPFCRAKNALNSYPQKGKTNLPVELENLLRGKRAVRLRSQGMCMFPSARPGDILHVEPQTAEQINIGDIVALKKFPILLAHRAIAKNQERGRTYIITQPDRMGRWDENDGPSFDEDILGVVTHLERDGRKIEVSPPRDAFWEKVVTGLRLAWMEGWGSCIERLYPLFRVAQQTGAYRKLVKNLRLLDDKGIDYWVHIPWKTNGALFRKLNLSEFAVLDFEPRSSVLEWNMLFYVNSRPAGNMSFVYKPDSCPYKGCWLSNASLRIRYRGTIVEEEIFQQVSGALGEKGIQEVWACGYPAAPGDEGFLKNFGLEGTAVISDELLGEKQKSFSFPIILRKEIA
jgi:hypothetical protein